MKPGILAIMVAMGIALVSLLPFSVSTSIRLKAQTDSTAAYRTAYQYLSTHRCEPYVPARRVPGTNIYQDFMN